MKFGCLEENLGIVWDYCTQSGNLQIKLKALYVTLYFSHGEVIISLKKPYLIQPPPLIHVAHLEETIYFSIYQHSQLVTHELLNQDLMSSQ